ncbi:hypothetical protein [Bradyrhizobium embrapense]
MAGTKSRPFCLVRLPTSTVIASEAKQSMSPPAETWIAPSHVAPRNASGRTARNALFTILVDLLFTTIMRRAFTKARDAARIMCATA